MTRKGKKGVLGREPGKVLVLVEPEGLHSLRSSYPENQRELQSIL